MTTRDGFSRLLETWLAEEGAMARPDYLGAVLGRTSATRQRPAWMSLRRWLPMETTLSRRTFSLSPMTRSVLVLAVLALLFIAALVLYAGSRPRLAPTFGPALNGRIGFESNGSILLAGEDGSGQTRLPLGMAAGSGPTFSQDGSRLAFYGDDPQHAGGGAMFVADVDGSHVRNITTGLALTTDPSAFPVWSADGKQLVFEVSDGDRQRLVVAKTDGSGAILLEQPQSESWAFPAFAPDGAWIAFADYPVNGDRPSLRLAHPDGTGQREVLTARPGATIVQDLQWATDGSHRLAFVVGQEGYSWLDVYDLDRDRITTIAHEPGAVLFGETWSPDGSRIASNHSNVGSIVVNADGTDLRILPEARCAARVAWSPDGTRLLCLNSVELGNGKFELLVIDPDGSAPVGHITWDGESAGMAGANFSWQRLAPTR